ncbi:MAG: type VI secretion system tip protein TssI/VgrG [Polyangiaceae bacterium]
MPHREYVRAFLESDDFDTEILQIRKLVATERMGEPFTAEVVAVIPAGQMTALRGESAEDTPILAKVVGSAVTITVRGMEREELDGVDIDARGWRDLRHIHGVVQSCTDHVNADTGDLLLTMRIVPRLHLLAMVQTFEVYLDKSLPDIFKAKLEAAGLAEGVDFEFILKGAYEPIDFTVQYRETDLAFLTRLCEHHGLSFHVTHDTGRDKVVITDDNGAFEPLEEPSSLPVRRSGEHSGAGVFDLTITRSLVESLYVQLDYNYRTPQQDLTSQFELPEAFGGGVVEYASHYRNTAEGQRFATLRAEERRCREILYQGKSNQPHFLPGRRATLEDDVRFGSAELLLVEVRHELEQPANLSDATSKAPHYTNSWIGIPAARPFRLARTTAKPRIHGILHAIVDPLPGGEIGEFANLDQEGRYTIRFFFDTAGSTRAVSSKRVRMIQLHAGLHYGAHMPLKPGIEVMVAFVDGDPDRPVIVGAIPNPVTPSPVNVVNATMNRFKTVSGILIEMKDRG